MRTIAKLAIGAAMACGAAVAATAPAAAQVSFGIGVGPAYPYAAPYPSCYDAYGNYLYSPYCTAYPGYYYGGPVVEPYFGVGLGFGGFGHFGGHERFAGGHGFAGGGHFGGGRVAMGGGHFGGGGGHRR